MDQLKQLLARLTLRQKITIAAVAVAVIGGLAGLSKWSKERDFKPLLTNLSAEDAGQAIARLRESGVEYRLSDNGSTILAPSAKIAELRLQLAAAGLPKSGRIGFELFDRNNFGATDFTEQVNYRRALEGELERSVASLAEVEQARVHLTFPKESIYTESRQPAKASVLVKLRPGARLSSQNVQAICNLTASAVEGLAPEFVSCWICRATCSTARNAPHSLMERSRPTPQSNTGRSSSGTCWPRLLRPSIHCSDRTSIAPASPSNAISPAASKAKKRSILPSP